MRRRHIAVPAAAAAVSILAAPMLLLLLHAVAGGGVDVGSSSRYASAAGGGASWRWWGHGHATAVLPPTPLQQRQLLEDEMAPEVLPVFAAAAGASLAVTAGRNGYASVGSLDGGRAVCPRSGGCAGGPGRPYTRPCTYMNMCRRP
ncbi:uncharacterized protein LOC121055984 [Oryza brachyantha]|uniref:uncharacterized protein LOC121055984 n=1 Tax=Oryza brachyantha TaxID=4533 RepID=UPI001AD987F5|nr:uncharacterized protein LOC121055984 [Oryza brachyantha]